jgi:peroxiredoxin
MPNAASKTPTDIDVRKLSQAIVVGEDHNKFKLGSFWDKSPAIFIFLRHFACLACRAHVTEVWAQREKYEKAGANLVFIGNGSPNMLKIFKEDLGLSEALIFTDPHLEAFLAAGFKRGQSVAFSPESLLNLERLRKKGYKEREWSPEQGDKFQLGGIIAVKPGNKVTYHYVSEFQGDFGVDDGLS